MSQLPKIPTSAYTLEMETLGAILDIPTFDGEQVPVSRNPLTSGTRPLQLLPLLGTEFPGRYETSRMRGFQTELRHAGGSCVTQLFLREQLRDAALRDAAVEVWGATVEVHGASVLRTPYFEQLRGAAVKVSGAASEVRDAAVLQVDLGKAHAGGSSFDAMAFWDLLDPPMRARVVTAGFGDYAAGLHRTQPRFQPTMRYALMEWWNDCTHTFLFGFGEMTLTPVDYAGIAGLRFAGPVAPLDARYQTAMLGAQLVRSLLGVTTQTGYTMQGCVSYEVVYRFWAERIRTRLAAWRELPVEAQPAAPAYTREERDQAARSFLFYIIPSQLLCTSQNKGDSAVLVWAYEYRIYPGGPRDDTPVDSRQIPRYLAHCHHTYASTEDPEYWRSFLNDRALSDLLLTPWEGEAWRTYPGHEVAELYTRSRLLLQGYWLDRYFLGERVCDIQAAPAQRRVPHVIFLCDSSQERKKHKTATHYRAEAAAEAEAAAAPAGPAGVVLGDVPFPADMEVVLDPGLGLGSGIIIPAYLRHAPPPPQLDPEHATHVPAQRYQELCQRFGFAQSFIAQLYSERHERMEVDRLQTVLEVEGIPLDFSEEDDGSSSDDAPPYPPPQAAASPSRRRR
ncbi:hypothetical protein JCGZ_01170 [Jatropha curcas]|uniref:Uncharacterized protein n=1 Tax=Jatropha curcas TaxID=180498 RepID=A0A067JGT2_JATCU|nr:hypothetical protein JCGZ_01170 [Jatropha curcas]